MIYLFMALAGLFFAFLFNTISKRKIRALYLYNVMSSFIGSIAVDPSQFSLIASSAGSLIVVFIVCCSIRV